MEPLRFALLGLGIGAAYVLVGQGIVLIYRGSGLINFAQGGIAMVCAQVFYELRDEHNWPALVALATSLGMAAAIGVVMQVLFLQRLRHASALVRLIATLGLLTVTQGVGIVVWGLTPRSVSSPLPDGLVEFGNDLVISEDRLFMVVFGVVLTGVLWAIYQRTRYGLATSATAENQQAAIALGWSPTVIGAANWALGSVLAGFAGILLAPITGLSVISLVLLVIPGLASALVGQFSSFWLTLAGGLLIGIAQSEAARYVSTPGWGDAVPFLVIVALVVVRGRAIPLRGELADRPVRVGTGRIRLTVVVPLVLLGGLAIGGMSGRWLLAISASALMGMVSLSLVVVTGYASQISLAQLTIAGVGALAAGNASFRWGWPFPVAVVFGTVSAVVVGLVVALPALRCRGVNLAVVTIALSLVIEKLVLSNADLVNGSLGLRVEPPSVVGFDVSAVGQPLRYTVMTGVAFVLCAMVVANVRRGSSGRRLLALRTNERAATSIGVNVFAAKLYAFGLGAAISGFAGSLAAFQFGRVNLEPYTTLGSVMLIVQTVIGGIGYVAGALIGGAGSSEGILTEAISRLDATGIEYVTMASGVVVLLTLVAHPNGVADTVAVLRQHWSGPRPSRSDGSEPLQPSGPPAPLGGATLRVRGLSVQFGGVHALQDVELDVSPGEVIGLIGPNGAGKTTLIDAVTGLTRSTGTIELDGSSLRSLSPRRRALAGLGRTFQAVELFDDMSVLDNVRTASDGSGGRCYATDVVLPRTRPLPSVAVAAIEDLGLARVLDETPDHLPAGQRRLVGIARTLATAPKIVLLDEPASGLSDEESRELGVLIRHLAERWNLAVLLVEHNVPLVSTVCDRVVALALGRVIAAGTPAEVLAHEDVIAAYLGTEPEPVRTGDLAAAQPR